MSWSSSKGRVRGKIASGGFNRPDNTLAEAIDTGAGIMAKGIMERAAEERAEKKREKAAAAAEARRLAAEQRKKEEEERKIERQVKAIAARKGIDDKNIEAYTYIRDQVEAFGTSAAALIEKDFDDGKLSLPMVDDMREVQGPDVASDFKVQVDGIDDPVAVDDLEAISTEMLLPQETRDSARLQMDMVAPVSEIPAESVGQTQGFAVNPEGNNTEEQEALDAAIKAIPNLANMTSSERQNTVDALRAVADKSPDAQFMLEVAESMTAEKSADTKSFYTGVSTVPAIEAKIKLAQRTLTGASRDTVLKDLNDLLKDRKDDDTALGLTDTVVYGTVTVNGTPVQSELVLKDDGSYYSVSQNRTYQQSEVSNAMSQDNADGLVSDATKIQTAVFAPMLEQRAGVSALLMQAKTIDDLVKQSDGKVLTFIGGRLPSILTRIQNEYESFQAFVSSADEAELNRLATENMPDEETLKELGISANQFARFNSQAIEFAFTYARAGMGQQRTTDNDFKAAYEVVTAGSSYPTYTQSLRELTAKGVSRAAIEHDKFLDHPTLRAANLRPGAGQLYEGMTTPLVEYLQGQGPDVVEQLAWAYGEGMPTDPSTTSEQTPPENPPVNINATLNQYMSSPGIIADKQTYDSLPEEDKDIFLSILSKQTGLPKDLISNTFSQ